MAEVKGFVICRVGYEYNDEVYYRSESEGGAPTKVYLDAKKAKAEAAKLNIESLLNESVGDYVYDTKDLFTDVDKVIEILTVHYPQVEADLNDEGYDGLRNFSEWWMSNAKTVLSEKEKAQLADLFTLSFYEVYPVSVQLDDKMDNDVQAEGKAKVPSPKKVKAITPVIAQAMPVPSKKPKI